MSGSQIKLEFKDTDINVEDSLIQAFHNFKTGDYVRFNVIEGDSPTIILNNKTELLTDEYFYYIGVINSNSFELYSSLDAAYSQFPATSIQFNSAGSGNFSFTKQKRSFSSKISVIPIFSSVRKSFSDFFQRNNTEGGLGITPDGSRWDLVRGIFRVLGNKAVSDSNPDSYPIAAVRMPFEDAEISVDGIANGSGVSLWITDSGNWWGLGLEQEEVDCNCSVGTECNRWNQGGLCTRWNSRNCRKWNSRNCATWNAEVWSCTTTYPCVSYRNIPLTAPGTIGPWATICVNYRPTTNCRRNASSNCSTYNSQNCRLYWSKNCRGWTTETCNRWNEFAFDCETCYPQWIRVLQSVNSTVTTVARFVITKTFRTEPSPQGGLDLFVQDTFLNKLVKGIKVFIQGKEISADLYHETNFQDKVDVEEDIIYNATGAEVTPYYGIMVIPSEYNQNNIIGSIEIEKND